MSFLPLGHTFAGRPASLRQLGARFSSAALTLLLSLALTVEAMPPPPWWVERGAVDPQRTPNPHAMATIGQLKGFTQHAAQELDAHLPGGAGPELTGLVQGWLNDYAQNGYGSGHLKPSDHQLVRISQLKYIAHLVWTRLQAEGYAETLPPWLTPKPETDSQMTVLSQLKTIFAFDLTADLDSNGLPDWWETHFFGAAGQNPQALAPSGSGLTLLQSFTQGQNPLTPVAPADTPPLAPNGAAGLVHADGTVDLSWAPLPSDGLHSPATSVLIERSFDQGQTWTPVTTTDPGVHTLTLDPSNTPGASLLRLATQNAFGTTYGSPISLYDPVVDSDGNGLPDGWELQHFGFIGVDPARTTPSGIPYSRAAAEGWNPNSNSSAGDGVSDGWKLLHNLAVSLVVSSLRDGIPDSWKMQYGFAVDDPSVASADCDLSEGQPAPDGLTNLEEFQADTDPWNPDTDGDGVIDGQEGWPGSVSDHASNEEQKKLAPPRLPPAQYAQVVISKIPKNYTIRYVNHRGQAVVFDETADDSADDSDDYRHFFFWEAGATQAMPIPVPRPDDLLSNSIDDYDPWGAGEMASTVTGLSENGTVIGISRKAQKTSWGSRTINLGWSWKSGASDVSILHDPMAESLPEANAGGGVYPFKICGTAQAERVYAFRWEYTWNSAPPAPMPQFYFDYLNVRVNSSFEQWQNLASQNSAPYSSVLGDDIPYNGSYAYFFSRISLAKDAPPTQEVFDLTDVNTAGQSIGEELSFQRYVLTYIDDANQLESGVLHVTSTATWPEDSYDVDDDSFSAMQMAAIDPPDASRWYVNDRTKVTYLSGSEAVGNIQGIPQQISSAGQIFGVEMIDKSIGKPMIWAKKTPTDPYVPIRLKGDAPASGWLNSRLEIAGGAKTTESDSKVGPFVWRNYQRTQLSELIPDFDKYSSFTVEGLSDEGVITATATLTSDPDNKQVISLPPVEILVKDPSNPSVKKSTDKLRVATLESAFGGSDYHQLANFMENDLDSFYFRMKNPAKTGAGKMKVRISTDSEGTEYDDAPTEIELIETPANSGDFISPAQILVSNEVDDTQPFTFDGTVINDEALNDRTHKIALGGKLIVEVDPSGGTNYQRMELATVPIEKTVKVKPIVLKAGLFNSPVISNAGVAEDMKTLRETFAQCGIKIVDVAPVQIDEDDIPDFGLAAGISTNINPGNLTVEERNLFDYIKANNLRADDEVTFIYVNYFTVNAFPTYPRGDRAQSYVEKLATAPASTYGNHIIISAEDKKPFTAPHELLHILLNATHPQGTNDYPTEWAHPRMTWHAFDGATDTGFSARKRVTKQTAGKQADEAKKSRFAK